MTGLKMFPIQLDDAIKEIPWALLEGHEAQAAANHSGQSLERLAERGGVMPEEALAIIEDRKWERMPRTAATIKLREYMERHVGVFDDVTPSLDYYEAIDRSQSALIQAAIEGDEMFQVMRQLDKAIACGVRLRATAVTKHTANELITTLEGIKMLLVGEGVK
jgi:hypothetical protein